MKVRIGFVSNSSSSSYIVDVPKFFTVTMKDLEGKRASEDLCDVPSYEWTNKINPLIKKVASGGTIYRDGGGEDSCFFWTVVEVLEKHNMVVMITDGPGGDGEDIITPFVDLREKKK